MSAFLRKALSVFTVAATTLYTVGLTAFVPVASAAVTSGMLIKASLKAVYYVGADGKRYVFPNEDTYFTWYSDFSTVVTITDAELAAIPIGGNVTFRPGVKMIKIDTDPKVYAVSHNGGLRWITTEAIAVCLYGSAWTTQVEDLSDAFFVNYTIGAPITDCSQFDKFAEMAASPTINADKNLVAGPTPTPTPVAINASLASDNPAGATVPKGATNVTVLKFNLVGSGTVTNLSFKDFGIGSTADLASSYLYEGATRLTSGKTFNSTTKEATFNVNLTFTGASRSFSLVIDVAAAATTFGQHQFGLTMINGATVSGVTGNTFTIGADGVSTVSVSKGTTPSNPTVGQVAAELANFKITGGANDSCVNRITLTQTGSIDSADLKNFVLKQGTTTVATAAAMSGDKIVLVFSPCYSLLSGASRNFTLYGDVSGRPGRTINIYIDEASDVSATDTKYGFSAAVSIDGTVVTPAFDSSNPVTLTTLGGELTVAFNGPISSDVSKGAQDVSLFEFSLTAASPMTIRNTRLSIAGVAGGFVIGSTGTDYFTDIKIINKATGAVVAGPISIPSTVADSATTTGTLTLTDDFDVSGTTQFAVTADLATAEDAGADEFFDEGYRVTLGAAGTIFVGGSDVKYQDSNDFVAASDIIPNTPIAGNVMTVRAASLKVGLSSTINNATFVKGSVDAQVAAFSLTAGSDSAIKVTKFIVDPRMDDTVDGTSLYSLTGDSNANTVISTASLWKKNADGTLTLLSGPKGVAGVTNSETITFDNFSDTIAAGQSSLYVVSVTLTNTSAGGYPDMFAITIQDDSNITAEDKDNNTVTALNASTGAAIDNGGVNTINDGTASAATVDATIAHTVTDAGTLTVAVDADTPKSMLIATGSTTNETKLKLTATQEAFIVDRLTIVNDNVATDDAVYSAVVIEYKNQAGATVTSTGTFVGDYSVMSGLSIWVPKDSSTVITLKGVINSAAGGAGNDVATFLGLDASAATGDFHAVGQSSSTVVEETGATNAVVVTETVVNQILDDADGIFVHYVFETYPTVNFAADTPSGNLVPSGNTLVAKINVTAGANEDVTFTGPVAGATNYINVNVAGSGAAGAADMWATDGSTELCRETVNFAVAADTFTCDFTNGVIDTNLVVAAGTTKTIFIYYDTLTAGLTTAGESIQTSLLDDAATNIDWSINLDGGNYQHADIIFRGDKFGGALVKP